MYFNVILILRYTAHQVYFIADWAAYFRYLTSFKTFIVVQLPSSTWFRTYYIGLSLRRRRFLLQSRWR